MGGWPTLFDIGFLALLPLVQTRSAFDPLPYVDPLIGSNNGGNVFAGASRPYALAKISPDVDGENTGGFATDDSNVTGFSSLHDSGTGGNPSLGNFPLFPQLCPGNDLNACSFRMGDRKVRYITNSVVARPGYFKIALQNGISAEMTAGNRTAVIKFEFPLDAAGGDQDPLVLLDLTDLRQSRQNASIKLDGVTGRMQGGGTFLPSFGAGSYQAYYCIDWFGAKIFDSGVWVNNRAGPEPKQIFVTRGFNNFFLEAGGYVRFQQLTNNTVTARVGLSFVNAEQACSNAEKEVPDLVAGFANLVDSAERAWREKLSPVSIVPGGASHDLQVSFYSGLYRSMLSPQNYTGENPYWNTPGVPYFDSFYCIWDSFRVQHPLLTIVDPHAQTQMLASLLDIYKNEGWLPDCHMSNCKGWTQGGSNADVVLVDAFVKNLTAGVDWDVALEAIINDAENEPLEWSYHGRGGLNSWKNLNYIPYQDFDPVGFGTNSRSISRTLEYSYNDFCLATLGRGLGQNDVYDKYIARSANWQHLWKADQKSVVRGNDTGFTGFFQPKYLNGTWGYQDPIACSALADFCSLTTNPSETFEASIWQYQFIVPQSISSFITLVGGDAAFVRRLDFFHTSGLADISNEPVFLTVFLYHYAGRPGLSASRIHTYIPSSFNSTHGGLPGNDDSGAMGSFVFFSVIGLFPVAGQNVYLISPPFFQEVSIKSPLTGKTATMRVTGGWDASYKNIYIQNATVNGKSWSKNWIGHEIFTEGWTLELVLGGQESDWGTKMEDRPPSWLPSMATL